MKKLLVMMLAIGFAPFVYAASGQVGGPLNFLGAQDFDHDNNGGTAALTNYAWVQFYDNDPNGSYDPDLDNDTNDYETECSEGFFWPIWFDISTDKGKAIYSSANSAVLSGYDVTINYTENAAGICVADDLFITMPGSLPED